MRIEHRPGPRPAENGRVNHSHARRRVFRILPRTFRRPCQACEPFGLLALLRGKYGIFRFTELFQLLSKLGRGKGRLAVCRSVEGVLEDGELDRRLALRVQPLHEFCGQLRAVALDEGFDNLVGVEVFRSRLADHPILEGDDIRSIKSVGVQVQLADVPTFTGGEVVKVTLNRSANHLECSNLFIRNPTGNGLLFGFAEFLPEPGANNPRRVERHVFQLAVFGKRG